MNIGKLSIKVGGLTSLHILNFKISPSNDPTKIRYYVDGMPVSPIDGPDGTVEKGKNRKTNGGFHVSELHWSEPN